MNLDVQVGDIRDDERWDAFVRRRNESSIFQESGWLGVVCTLPGYRAVHVTVSESGNCVAVFPNLVVRRGGVVAEVESLPAGYGGPLVGDARAEVTESLRRALHDAGLRMVRHVVRTCGPVSARYSAMFQEWGYRPSLSACTMVIDLTLGVEAAFKRLSAANRRDLRRAESRGLEIAVEPLAYGNNIEMFYPLYCEVVARVGGRIRPKSFFQVLAARFDGDAVIVKASCGGELLGGRVHLADRHRSTAHYLYGATGKEGKERLAGAAMHQAALEWAASVSMARYDMGSTRADLRDSLFRYKSGWGADPVPTPQWTYEHCRPLMSVLARLRRLTLPKGRTAPRTYRTVWSLAFSRAGLLAAK